MVLRPLGRAPAGNVTNVTINLVEPGKLYGDRINQLDFRVAKLLKFSGKRAMIALDLYNATNANPVLTYNQTFNPTVLTGSAAWLSPRSILTSRLFRISAEFNF